jgi:hypothetical protein
MSHQGSVASMTDTDLLRHAIVDARSRPETASFELGQIYGAFVEGRPAMARVWEEETAPLQLEVDLHLNGPTIHGHAAEAHRFGTFVSGVADASKFTARAMSGAQRYQTKLLIEGVGPGSVRVVLRAAPDPPTAAGQTMTHEVPSVDSGALRKVAAVLTYASGEEDPDTSPLEGAVVQLPAQARQRLSTAVNAAMRGGWEIVGTARQRGLGLDEVRLTRRGASRLASALKSASEERSHEWLTGSIDGLKRSLGCVWFVPRGAQRAFAADVADDKLLLRVGELLADPAAVVTAEFDVFTSIPPGDESRVRRSRVLTAIRPATDGQQDHFL